jgi:hypothetical protein
VDARAGGKRRWEQTTESVRHPRLEGGGALRNARDGWPATSCGSRHDEGPGRQQIALCNGGPWRWRRGAPILSPQHRTLGVGPKPCSIFFFSAELEWCSDAGSCGRVGWQASPSPSAIIGIGRARCLTRGDRLELAERHGQTCGGSTEVVPAGWLAELLAGALASEGTGQGTGSTHGSQCTFAIDIDVIRVAFSSRAAVSLCCRAPHTRHRVTHL